MRFARDDVAKRAKAIASHYMSMGYSYVGLMAALVSEGATRLPATRPAPGNGLIFGLTIAAATGGVFVIGAWLIQARRDKSLAPFGLRA